jgi:hypothetical protein
MAKTRSRKHWKRESSQRCACTRALGAHTQGASARRPTPGARRPRQDNVRVVLRSGAWGQSCGGPRRSFRSILWLFSLIFQLEQTWLYEIIEFSKWLKSWVLAFSVFTIIGNLHTSSIDPCIISRGNLSMYYKDGSRKFKHDGVASYSLSKGKLEPRHSCRELAS